MQPLEPTCESSLKWLFVMLLVLNAPVSNAAVHCKSVDREVAAIAAIVPAHASARVVIARSPVPVFSAPNGVCKSNARHLSPRAKVKAHLEYGGFTAIRYADQNSSETRGWVQSIHLCASRSSASPAR